MITLDNQAKAIIIAAIVVLVTIPKPSLATIKGWLTKLVPSNTGSLNLKSLIIPAISIFFLLTSETPAPGPAPVPVVQTDNFDKCCEDYRMLLVDVWSKYHTSRDSMKDDEARLEFLNTQQVAAFTAAFQPYINKAQVASSAAGGADELAQQLKERKF